MTTQPETVKVRHPFKVFLEARGWKVINIHGNQFQSGLPDLYICHPSYTPRWIETKLISATRTIKFTDDQKRVFPILHMCKVPIYVISHTDLRGEKMLSERERLYQKLFKEPNVMLALDKMTAQFTF